MPLLALLLLTASACTAYHTHHHHAHYAPTGTQLEEVASWKFLSFSSTDGTVQVSENALFTGVTRAQDRLFVSVPRFRTGVPATLTWIPRVPHEMTLQVYPDVAWQDGHVNQCRGMVSVFRSRLDSCGRLWAIDSGAVLNGPGQGCGPKLIVFDLNRDRVARVITIPSEALVNSSMLSFIAFDPRSRNCDDMLVYIADARGFGLIVYDALSRNIWRFEHETMRQNPNTSTYTIANETASTRDGINSMAISNNGTHRLLYFHGLSERALYSVPTEQLRVPGGRLDVQKVADKTSPAVALAVDSQGVLFYVPVAETALVSFDPRSKQQTTLLTDTQRLQFVSDITVDSQGDLWLVSNRFQSFASGTFSRQDVNLRILRLPRP